MPIRRRQGGSRLRGQRGHAMLEMAIVSALIFPLLIGAVGIGFNLTRHISIWQIVRDAGLMYTRQVDFTLESNKDILVRLAQGTKFTKDNTGQGLMMFSKVTLVTDGMCAAASLSGSSCTNRGMYVVTQRVYVGNRSLRQSNFGMPLDSLLDAKGNVSNYITESSARAGEFGSLLTMGANEYAFVTEGFFKGAAFNFGPWPTAEDLYARALF